VKAALPGLVGELARLDPAGAAAYKTNAESFAGELDALHDEVSEMLEPFAGEHLLLVHPSFLYFMADYGLELGGLVEPAPGKEPTPRSMLELIEIAQERRIKAIFTEPQLPEEPVRVLAEETGLPVFTLDPLGGVPGRMTYEELTRYNAETIAKALGGGFAGEV
jgi:ABC-type Zn uptake system ZnuABC Zn-binding protein ZnuA